METLRSFKSSCRGENYDYKLIRVDGELLIEAYQNGTMTDRMTLWDTDRHLKIAHKACDTIEARGRV